MSAPVPLGRRLLEADEAAAYLAIAPRTLRAWVAAGRIPVVRAGRTTRYDVLDLDDWVKAAKADGASVSVCSVPLPPSNQLRTVAASPAHRAHAHAPAFANSAAARRSFAPVRRL